MGIIKTRGLVHDFIRRDEEDNVESITTALDHVDLDVKDTNQSGLRYKDYLHILLYFASSEKMTFRFMDLMEMDIRLTEGNESFRMDACIESIEAEASRAAGKG